MGWSIGFDTTWNRDIGYGVPAYCDHPGCPEKIDRGLSYVCCYTEPFGGEHGCGRFYCGKHEDPQWNDNDERVCGHTDDGHISPDHPDWITHKLNDESWNQWRNENPVETKGLRALLQEEPGHGR